MLKNAQAQEQSWTFEFKNQGQVTVGKPSGKADVTLSMADETFMDMAAGKINGQKAFMSGIFF